MRDRMMTLTGVAPERAPFREGDKVAFRRSSGEIAYGTVSEVHAHRGLVTVFFCEKTLYKTLPYDEVSGSALPFVVGARRTTGRKKPRRTTGKVRRTSKHGLEEWFFMTDSGEFGPFNSRSTAKRAADKETQYGMAGKAIVYQGRAGSARSTKSGCGCGG